jgi:hypothetical protein
MELDSYRSEFKLVEAVVDFSLAPRYLGKINEGIADTMNPLILRYDHR